jgi:predicted tellurium resistance membrane protein TerC
MFVGVKMLVMDWYKIPIPMMLAVVFGALVVSVAASLARRPQARAA